MAAVAVWAGLTTADTAAQDGASSDRGVLEALYDATGGPGWANGTNWKTGAPLEDWYGVATGPDGRVTALYLGQNWLTGPLPPELGRLASLEALQLNLNSLSGPIPPELGNLANLGRLRLDNNELSGPMPPELGRLANLTELHLDRNAVSGPIPPELGRLASLETLDLAVNALSGPMPPELGRLAGLEALRLHDNASLAGPLPSELTRLSRLTQLDISETALCAPRDAEIQAWLAGLEFQGDTCSRAPEPVGTIPGRNLTPGGVAAAVSVGTYFRDPDGDPLTFAAASGNPDTAAAYAVRDVVWLVPRAPGTATVTVTAYDTDGQGADQALAVTVLASPGPTSEREVLEAIYGATDGPSWTNRTNWGTDARPGDWYGVTTGPDGRVIGLQLSGNGLRGPMPQALGRLPGLESLSLEGNELSGPVPPALGGLAELETLALGKNRFSGPVPAELGDLSDLRELRLGDNRLHGAIPPELGRLANLQVLNLGGNALSGPVPPGLGDLAGLESLRLDGNALEGPIPPELGRLAGLETLALGGNALSGAIPPELAGLVDLRELHLEENALSGPIPAELGGLANLQVLNLGGNELSDEITVSLGSLANLRSLNLGDNALTGPIPPELGSLANLQSLLLGNNELTGPIPPELGSLPDLQSLNLGFNELTGPIPPELGSLPDLRVLNLHKNTLSGPIPPELGSLPDLQSLNLSDNELTGPIPPELGSLPDLRSLYLHENGLTGPVPPALSTPPNLQALYLDWNWGLSGPLPAGLRLAPLERLGFLVTGACAPVEWRDWLATIDSRGALCGAAPDATIDVAVFYTPAAGEAAGGAAAMATRIDLMLAETNEALAASEVRHRLALVARAETPYVETGNSFVDVRRLMDPSDGHLDEVHAVRDRTGADLVHLIFEEGNVGGIANVGGPFGLTCLRCGGLIFAHEVGHNLGLWHDRYQVHNHESGALPHPAYGYVNQRGFDTTESRRWRTVMAYATQCRDREVECTRLPRYSNSRQTYRGDLLGLPLGEGTFGVEGPADAAAVLDATGPAVALWRDRIAGGPNRPPTAVGTLPDRRLRAPEDTLAVDVSRAFVDADGDALTHTASSSAPAVVTTTVSGTTVTLTAAGFGAATVAVTATDPGGLSATQAFAVTVSAQAFTDDPIVAGVTPVRAVHFLELRARIDAARAAAGLAGYAWTDRVLTAGVTPIRLVHLQELRRALEQAYAASGRAAPAWTDALPSPGSTPVRATHLTELRAAVVALE